MNTEKSVYIVTFHPFPVGLAPTNRILCYARGLQGNGMPCKVVTMAFSDSLRGEYCNIPYVCFSRGPQKNVSVRLFRFWFRLKSLLLGFTYCCRNIRRDDIIIIYSQMLMANLLFLALARWKRIRIYYELCEIPFYNQKIINRFYRFITLRFFFPLFRGFIVISTELKLLAEKHKAKMAHIIKIPIMVDQDRFLTDSYTDMPDLYKERLFIFYAGAISEKKDGIVSSVKAYIQAQKQIKDALLYLIAGPPSPDLLEINELAVRHHMEDSILYVGNLRPEEVVGYLKHAVLFISNKKNTLQNRNGFSTKIGEVLISGIPVITTDVGELSLYLQDGISAYIVPSAQQEMISEKIVRAFTFPEERRRIATAGKKVAVQQFDSMVQGRRLVDFLRI